jgi:hypothetical protein
VGSGLSITPLGVLSAINSGAGTVAVKHTAQDYLIQATDYYIGATKKDINITLPLGTIGKVYVIKNQVSGDVKVLTTLLEKIDTSSTKTLGTNESIMVVFDGLRWNIIM